MCESCRTSSIVSNFLPYSKDSNEEETNPDFDEQRKIAEGADALLNLAGVSTTLSHCRMHHVSSQDINPAPKAEGVPRPKRRSTPSDYSSTPEKRRKRWREWGDGSRYLKQIRG